MKKLIALLLSLMLLLPVVALGEETYSVDFEDFTLTISSADEIQKGVKAEGQLLFLLFPEYSDEDLFHNNINCSWMNMDVSLLGLFGAEAYAEMVLEQVKGQMVQQGVATSNEKVLNASFDAETKITTLTTFMTVDYSALGMDKVADLYQAQYYIPADDGTGYLFTLSAASAEGLEAMGVYLDKCLQMK